jgi:hypothetical protein
MKSWRDKDEFKSHVLAWADKLDVRVRSLAVRPMRNKWASCSTAGRLNFSNELLSLQRDLADYVIVHELLHFSVPNHGRLWKSLMHAHLGDYERHEARLRKAASRSGTPNHPNYRKGVGLVSSRPA